MLNLKEGEVLAFKTDTVWGFGANPNDIKAIEKIYEIKKRDIKKPLILMSNDFSHLEKYIKVIPEYAKELGATYIVVGRAITKAADPVAAYQRCVKEFC